MAHLPLGEWALLRGEVASFFQSARVKLPELVSSGVQAPDGTLTKPIVGMLPRGTEPPGASRAFSAAGAVATEAPVRGPRPVNGPGAAVAGDDCAPNAAAAAFMAPGAPAWLHRPFVGYSDPGNPIALGEYLYSTAVDVKALLAIAAATKTRGAPSGPLMGSGSG